MAQRQATTSIKNWRFWDQHVQSELQGGQFINASTILLAAGPPRISDSTATSISVDSSDIAYPLGIIENFSLSQNKQLQRMFEIGSKRSYFVPGRTVGQIMLGRVLYFGPSLMRILYAYYPPAKIPGAHSLGFASRELDAGRTSDILDRPGEGKDTVEPNDNVDFFINLASDLFDKPLGLMCYLRDSQNDSYGAFYLEDCYLQSHQFNINSSSVLVAEGVSAQYDRLVPINIKAANTSLTPSPSITVD